MGGSSGGGGSSGQVRYPAYVETIHADWLNDAGADTIDASVTEVMNDALGASPFAAAVPYDPDADIAVIIAGLGDLETAVAAFAAMSIVDASIPSAITESDITTDVAAHEAQISALKDTRLTSTILPRFEAGMRDIGAVVSSAFVVGKAIIESDADAEVTRDVAAHGSKLRIATKPTSAQVAELNLKKNELEIREEQAATDFRKMITQLIIEAYRIKIVAKKEEADLEVDYSVADAKWDMEVFQYGANLMAAPAGGTAVPSGKKVSATSVIGGALSGAAAGAIAGSIIPGLGTALGAGIGAVMGIGGGLLG